MFLARTYSHYSILSALPKIGDLVENAKQKGWTKIALTDEDTMSGLVEFQEKCLKSQIEGVFGTTLRIQDIQGLPNSYSKIVFLAKNLTGLKQLNHILSFARLKQSKPMPHLTWDSLQAQIVEIQNRQNHPKYGSKKAENEVENKEKIEVGKQIENIENKETETNFSSEFVIWICSQEGEIGKLLRQKKWTQLETVLQKILEKVENLPGFSKERLETQLVLEAILPLETENWQEILELNEKLLQIASKFKLKVLATPAPRYLEMGNADSFRTVLAVKKAVKLYDIQLERDFSLPSWENWQKQYESLPALLDYETVAGQLESNFMRTNFDSNVAEAYFPIFELPEGQNDANRLSWNTYIQFLNKFHPASFGDFGAFEQILQKILGKLG